MSLAPPPHLIADETLIVKMPSAGHVGHAPIGGVRPQAVSADCDAFGLQSCLSLLRKLFRSLRVSLGLLDSLEVSASHCDSLGPSGAGLTTCQPLPWIKSPKKNGLPFEESVQNGPTKTSPIQCFQFANT